MKLHEKILTHYMYCSSPVDKEGYLCKKGERNTSYQKRWFVLKGNLLFYKERHGEREPLGVIVLEGCSVQLCESEEQHAFSLVFSGVGHRTYKFAAEDQKSQESWIKALLSANHEYLSLLVKDLEKQYDEVKRAAYPGNSYSHSTVIVSDAEQLSLSLASLNSGSSACSVLPVVREGRYHSTNSLLQAHPASSKQPNKKSPKLWPKRNAHVTPINGPAPLGEWPLLGSGQLEQFSELHEHYGKEVKELRADWLRRKEEALMLERDLIDFG
ncbi:sesquipedalian-1 [Brienomyrus brachyistius]|uniref:sesquipedalian-1 n=1 Tax=Brienomyrus brachyistius TaxID=42636 RepID=UPI0020B43491|nr:sesquipedalian-1 [Brienomyrus brachyistius]XP_048868850.1 sesquipedalian-1 [Brienomyrus brachyistius]